MEKEKKQKNSKKLEKAMTAYFDVSVMLGLDKIDVDDNNRTKIKVLLEEGVKTLSEINQKTDGIIGEDYSEISEFMNIPVSKQQYREIVSIMTKIRMNDFSDKNKEKYEENVKQKMFDQCLREKFLDKVVNQSEDTIPVPDWNKNISLNIVTSDDKEFNEVLQRSIERSIEIKNVLEDLLLKYGLAFEYLTEMKYSKRDYKTMVEWKYMLGGVPNENSAPRLFSLFYKFNQAVRLAADFDFFGMDELLTEMGMQMNLVEPLPRSEHFQWWTKDMVDRYCSLAKDGYYEWLEENR